MLPYIRLASWFFLGLLGQRVPITQRMLTLGLLGQVGESHVGVKDSVLGPLAHLSMHTPPVTTGGPAR